ncbi:MAG: DVU_1557 family redox protein [Anaerolineaceae bacterium]
MNPSEEQTAPVQWICSNCNVPLETGQVMVSYLGNAYPVDLLRCPHCGLVLVPEDLALGRMIEVEKALEDK